MKNRILGIIGGIALIIALLSPLMRSRSHKVEKIFGAAEKLFEQGNYISAMDKYNEVIVEATEHGVKSSKGGKDFIALANYNITICYVQLAEQHSDIRYYKSAITHIEKINPTTISTQHQEDLSDLWVYLLFYKIGLANHKLENYEIAQSAFNILLKNFPNSEFTDNAKLYIADSLVKEAEVLIESHRYSKAISVLAKARAGAPGHKAIHYNLGKAYLGSGKLEFAKNAVREALKRDSNYYAARRLLDTIREEHYRLGLSHQREGKYNQAIREFKEVIILDKELNRGRKTFKEVYYYLAKAYFELDDFEKAKQAATEALSIDRGYQAAKRLQRNATNHVNYKQGLAYLKNRQYKQAISKFKNIVNSDSTFTTAHYNLGKAYFEYGNFEDAENSAKKAYNQKYSLARQLLREIKQKYYDIGFELLIKKKKYEEATVKLKKVIVLDKEVNAGRKTFKEAYYYLGKAYFELGDFEKAKQAATEALSIDRNYQEARHLQRNATNHINYEQGLVYLKNRQYKQAVSAFRKVVNSDSSFTEAYYHLGKAYLGDDNLEDAENAARKSLIWNYTSAHQLLQQIQKKHYDIGLDLLEKDKYAIAVNHIKKAIELGMKSKKVYTNLAIAYVGLGEFELAKSTAKTALQIDPNYEPALQILNSID